MTVTKEQLDSTKLVRILQSAAYSHGVTDSIEYSSDKRYRIAQEKSEEASEALTSYIAQLEERVNSLETFANWSNANWDNQDINHSDFRVASYVKSKAALAGGKDGA